jgi:predicted glycosyltransferase
MKLLFWVQHLLGIGHVRRAALISHALTAAGLDVTIAAGGFPVAGVDYGPARLIQLSPARSADASFKHLVDADDQPLSSAWKERRAAELLTLAADLRPDIILLETYPFGRRAFRFEPLPLLAQAAARRPRPLLAASVRDILVAKDNPAREAEMADLARRYLDLVLVHGDPALIPFAATFPPAERIADLIRPTGYVAPPRRPPIPGRDGAGEVVVSVGGGAVGLPLLRAALGARPLSPLADAPWRLLAGPDIPADAFNTLAASAPPGVIVERARPDFPDLLGRCRLSISQGGYNTLMDVLHARCRAVIVPFAIGNETEQTTRARLLENRGLVHVVEEAGLTAEHLADGIARALTGPPLPAFTPALDGAAVTARLLIEAAERRQTVALPPLRARDTGGDALV